MNPRAIAALCSLRRGPRAVEDVMAAIGDANAFATLRLLRDMERARLATQLHSQSVDQRWYLAELGQKYLDENGIRFSSEVIAQEKVTP